MTDFVDMTTLPTLLQELTHATKEQKLHTKATSLTLASFKREFDESVRGNAEKASELEQLCLEAKKSVVDQMKSMVKLTNQMQKAELLSDKVQESTRKVQFIDGKFRTMEQTVDGMLDQIAEYAIVRQDVDEAKQDISSIKSRADTVETVNQSFANSITSLQQQIGAAHEKCTELREDLGSESNLRSEEDAVLRMSISTLREDLIRFFRALGGSSMHETIHFVSLPKIGDEGFLDRHTMQIRDLEEGAAVFKGEIRRVDELGGQHIKMEREISSLSKQMSGMVTTQSEVDAKIETLMNWKRVMQSRLTQEREEAERSKQEGNNDKSEKKEKSGRKEKSYKSNAEKLKDADGNDVRERNPVVVPVPVPIPPAEVSPEQTKARELALEKRIYASIQPELDELRSRLSEMQQQLEDAKLSNAQLSAVQRTLEEAKLSNAQPVPPQSRSQPQRQPERQVPPQSRSEPERQEAPPQRDLWFGREPTTGNLAEMMSMHEASSFRRAPSAIKEDSEHDVGITNGIQPGRARTDEATGTVSMGSESETKVVVGQWAGSPDQGDPSPLLRSPSPEGAMIRGTPQTAPVLSRDSSSAGRQMIRQRAPSFRSKQVPASLLASFRMLPVPVDDLSSTTATNTFPRPLGTPISSDPHSSKATLPNRNRSPSSPTRSVVSANSSFQSGVVPDFSAVPEEAFSLLYQEVGLLRQTMRKHLGAKAMPARPRSASSSPWHQASGVSGTLSRSSFKTDAPQQLGPSAESESNLAHASLAGLALSDEVDKFFRDALYMLRRELGLLRDDVAGFKSKSDNDPAMAIAKEALELAKSVHEKTENLQREAKESGASWENRNDLLKARVEQVRSEAATNLRKTREAIRIEALGSMEAKLQRLEVQIGSFEVDVSGKLQEREEEKEGVRERLGKAELSCRQCTTALDAAMRRIGSLETMAARRAIEGKALEEQEHLRHVYAYHLDFTPFEGLGLAQPEEAEKENEPGRGRRNSGAETDRGPRGPGNSARRPPSGGRIQRPQSARRAVVSKPGPDSHASALGPRPPMDYDLISQKAVLASVGKLDLSVRRLEGAGSLAAAGPGASAGGLRAQAQAQAASHGGAHASASGLGARPGGKGVSSSTPSPPEGSRASTPSVDTARAHAAAMVVSQSWSTGSDRDLQLEVTLGHDDPTRASPSHWRGHPAPQASSSGPDHDNNLNPSLGHTQAPSQPAASSQHQPQPQPPSQPPSHAAGAGASAASRPGPANLNLNMALRAGSESESGTEWGDPPIPGASAGFLRPGRSSSSGNVTLMAAANLNAGLGMNAGLGTGSGTASTAGPGGALAQAGPGASLSGGGRGARPRSLSANVHIPQGGALIRHSAAGEFSGSNVHGGAGLYRVAGVAGKGVEVGLVLPRKPSARRMSIGPGPWDSTS